MLKDFEKSKQEDKSVLNEEIKALRAQLMAQQQQLREAKLPVMVLIEGWSAAGKGTLIKELISEIDPRFYQVISPLVTPESECRYPFLYPFASAIPENGKITFLDSGWMENTVQKGLKLEISKAEFKRRIRMVNEFERQLRDGGYLLLKLFLHGQQHCNQSFFWKAVQLFKIQLFAHALFSRITGSNIPKSMVLRHFAGFQASS